MISKTLKECQLKYSLDDNKFKTCINFYIHQPGGRGLGEGGGGGGEEEEIIIDLQTFSNI